MACLSIKRSQRHHRLLRRLAQYVQANCNDDVQFVLKSGFQAKTTAVRSQTPLDKATILSVDNGHTKQLVVSAQKVPRAQLYCTKYKRLPWAPTTPSVRFKQRASSTSLGR